MRAEVLMDLMDRVEKADMDDPTRERMLRVLDSRKEGGPYRTHPFEGYLQELERELKAEQARNLRLADRVVELETDLRFNVKKVKSEEPDGMYFILGICTLLLIGIVTYGVCYF